MRGNSLSLSQIIIENLSHVRAQSTLDNRERVFCELNLLRNSFFVKQKNISLKEAFLSDARTRTCLFFCSGGEI